MRTVGEILRKRRTEKGLGLEFIERKIKIRKKYLSALERNQWHKLPPATYIKGFIKSYSAFLGLNPEEQVAIFRRQFLQERESEIIPKGISKSLNSPFVKLTSQLAAVSAFVLFLIVFLGYIFFQYKSLTSPPALEILQPNEGEIIQSESVKIVGKTDSQATVSINNQQIALSHDGNFTTNIILPPGTNSVIIESTSKHGRKKIVTRTIQVLKE